MLFLIGLVVVLLFGFRGLFGLFFIWIIFAISIPFAVILGIWFMTPLGQQSTLSEPQTLVSENQHRQCVYIGNQIRTNNNCPN